MRIKSLILTASVFLFSERISFGQNLVPNGSFEQYDTCPTNINGSYLRYADFWINPTSATPDYLNACDGSGSHSVPYNITSGYQPAFEGAAYTGIAVYVDTPGTNYREYIQTQLVAPLQTDSCYKLSFYVSLSNYLDLCTVTNFDAYFSPLQVSSSTLTVLSYTPQFTYIDPSGIGDTATWYKIEGIFQAQGGENFMTIGNFHDDFNTTRVPFEPSSVYGYSYYLIDSISLVKVTCPIDIGIEESQQAQIFNVFPNPSAGAVTFDYSFLSGTSAALKLYDVSGRLIRSYNLSKGANNRLSISEGELRSGIYFYSLILDGIVKETNKLAITKGQ